MNFNIYNSIILAGIIQGVIFAIVVLSTKKYRNNSTFFLMGVILCTTYSNFQYYLTDTKLLTATELQSTFMLPIASLSGVILLFYVMFFLEPEKKISLRHRLWFIPFSLFLIIFLIFKFAYWSGYQNDKLFLYALPILNFHEVFSILFTLILLSLTYVRIIKFEKTIKENNYTGFISRLNWLKLTLMILFFLTIVWAILIYKMLTNPDPDYIQSFYVLWIGLSFMIYWLGYIGIYKYGIIEERKQIRVFKAKKEKLMVTKRTNKHIESLDDLMIRERKFLDPNITQEKVAQLLNINKSHLSRLIRSELNTNFPEYLNSLRVKEAKSYLMNTEFNKYTIIAIGLESGFNSKATFNTQFKKFTGMTPSEFKKTNLKH